MLRTPYAALIACAFTLIAGCTTAPQKTDAVASTDRTPTAASTPAPAAAQPAAKLFDLPYLTRTLDNGLKVFVVKTAQKGVVSLQIPVSTGSRNEVEPGKTGFAHFFEHMMYRGTPLYPAEKYGAIMKATGADQNAYTDDDYTNYYANFTTEDLDQVLQVEGDRFQHLAYSEEQFRTEALAVKGEYLKNNSNPVVKGFERLQDLAFTQHTYKHTGMGFFEDIENMPNQLEYSKTFFQRWYRPDNTSVIVVGDVDPEATVAMVEKYFGPWTKGVGQVDVPVEPPQTVAKYEHLKWDGPTLPWIVVGWHGPAFDPANPDGAALALLSEIYFGETSDLYQKLVVKEQLVDQLSVGPPRNKDPGLFVLAARLIKPEYAGTVTKAIQDALLQARTRPVDAEQLAATKSRLKYGFAAGMESASSIAAILAAFVHYERDIESLNRFYATFDRVDAAAVIAAANRVFTDNNRAVVSISNDAALAGANDFRRIDAEVAAAGVAPLAPATNDGALAAGVGTQHDAEAPISSSEFMSNQARLTVPLTEQRNDSPLIDVSLIFDTGAAYDPVGKKGLAALTATLITEGGSIDRTYDEIQKDLYPLAAPFVAQVDKEMIKFSGTVHKDNAEKWWRLASEQLFTPGFRQEDLQRVKQQQLNAIRVSLRGNNDEEFGKEALYETIYGRQHPYGTLNLGRAKDVESITLDDVRNFYQSQLTRGGLVAGLAGGYNDTFRDQVMGITMRRGWRVPAKPSAPAVAVATTREATVIQKESPAVAVSFGLPLSIKRGDPDWVALWLVRSWLGEHRNSSGRLYDRVREQRGMNYGDYAYVEYFPNGMYLMQPEPNYARQNDLFQVWLRPLRSNNDAVFATRTALFELDKLVRGGMTQEEFEASRAYLRKFVAILTATQSKQLGYTLDSNYYGTPDFIDYVRKDLAQLTLAQVNTAIRKHFKLDGLRFVFITKDAADLAKRLKTDASSPVTYNSDKPKELLAEDKVIQKLPLRLGNRVKVVKDSDWFE